VEVQPALSPGPFEVKAAAEEWFSVGDVSRTETP
jgi:hypothetical protein